MSPLSPPQFLAENAMGIGAVALAWLTSQQSASAVADEAPQGPGAL